MAENRSSAQSNLDKPVVSSTVKKRRSPSTRERNRLRWERWQAKRRMKASKSSCQPNSDIHPQDPPKPTQADTEPSQLGPERNSLCTSRKDSDTKDNTSLSDKISAPIPLAWKEPSCFHCGKQQSQLYSVLKKCTRCLSAFYCGRDCQIFDWHKHRTSCLSAKTNSASEK